MALGPVNIQPLQERNPIVDEQRRPLSSFIRALNKAFRILADAISGVIEALEAAAAAQQTADDALEGLETKQPLDALLTSISGLSWSAGRQALVLTAADTAGLVNVGAANAADILDRQSGDARYASSGSGVLSFNTRTGAVTLTSTDVTGALGFTPISGNQTITLSGDASGSGTTAITVTLATVNSNVGSFGTATQVPQITVNGKGLITAVSNVTITPAASSITGAGDLTRTNDTNVTLTLGGTPTGALLKSASLTLGWAGTLAVARGGTGGGTASGTLLDNIAGFASTGMLARTAAGTYAFRTITGTANEITVTNGDGVSGAPTLSIPTAVTFTGKTITGGIYSSVSRLESTGRIASGGTIYAVADATNATNSVGLELIWNTTSSRILSFSRAASTYQPLQIVGSSIALNISASDVLTIAAAGATVTGLLTTNALSANIRTITATASVAATDYTILCDATSGAITVNLPAAASSSGRVLNVKKIDATANTVTIDGNASETIDGATTKAISTQWSSFTIKCYGSAWFIL